MRGARLAQNLARQAQIDRPARRRVGNRKGAIDNIHGLFGEFQLVVPFDGFADHGGLITHFLPPADRYGAGAEPALFDDGRATGKNEYGNMLGCRIDRTDNAIGETHISMSHDGLCASRRQIIAVRHAHGGTFVRNDDGLW